MNTYSIVILAALILKFAVGLMADLLNLRALKPELPPGLEEVYEEADYRKSQEYIRANTRFGIIHGVFSLAVLLAFWFSGGFNYLDEMVRNWHFNSLVNGLLYTGILLLAYNLLNLPFEIYHTFVIEERFGFNSTTCQTFIKDRIKGIALALLLGIPLLAGILTLFQYAGNYAWLYCWAGVSVFSLAVQYVAPKWIIPLFNKFTPMETGELKEAILKYASSVNFPVKNVLVMDGSRRSSRANAFFTGFGRNKRIALFDTLIAQQTMPEIEAILAHEIGHYKKKHVIHGIIISIIHAGLIFFLLSLLLNSEGLYQAFYVKQPSIYTGLVFFGLLYMPIEMALSIALQEVSRRHEYTADRFAAETIENPEDMVTGLKKLHAKNLANLNPHPVFVFLNYSHPPLLQRIRAIRNVKRPGG